MFFPLAVETLDVWSPNSLETLKRIARRTMVTSNMKYCRQAKVIQQQLSVRLWQYNARMSLATETSSSSLDVEWTLTSRNLFSLSSKIALRPCYT